MGGTVLNDVILKINYIGDTAMGFFQNDLVADEFYKGMPWEIGLCYFSGLKKAKQMNFYFRPIYKDAPFIVDLEKDNRPDFKEKPSFAQIGNMDFIPVYSTFVRFE